MLLSGIATLVSSIARVDFVAGGVFLAARHADLHHSSGGGGGYISVAIFLF
jgi:hypothetical protein